MAIKDTFLREVKIGDRVELMIGANEIEGIVVALDLDTVRIRKNKGKESVLLLDSISYYEKRQKKQVAEVDRMAAIKRSLQLAKNTPYKSVKQGPSLERVFIVNPENQKKQDYLLEQLIKKTDTTVYVHYDTDKIFNLADSLIELLKNAKQNGTTETINRCIIALNYALSEGLAPVPKNKKDEEVKKQREDILSAYYQICNETLIQDNLRNAIEEKEKEKAKKEKELDDAKNDLDLFAASHYAAFKKVKELTPDQRTKLTGTESQIAAKMRRATDRHVELVHIEQRIGQINLNLINVEYSCNNLFNIIKDLQVSVKRDNVEETNRLTREWEQTVREEQENIGKLREAANEMNIAFDVIYNSRETKEAIISINDDYENMVHENMQCAAQKVEDVGCQRPCITESSEPSLGISADTVQFSIVSQRKIQTARYLEIGLFMYEDSYRHVIQKLIDESGDILQEKSSGYQQVKRYTDITAVLQSNNIAYCEEITLRWMGKYLKFDFVAEVPESYLKKEILFWADIFVEGIKLSHLALIVSVDAQKEVAQIERKDIRSAFVSYSSKDREQVISIVYGMKKARPDMDIYLDVERLV